MPTGKAPFVQPLVGLDPMALVAPSCQGTLGLLAGQPNPTGALCPIPLCLQFPARRRMLCDEAGSAPDRWGPIRALPLAPCPAPHPRGFRTPYIRTHAQEMDPTVAAGHIDLYVNDFSVDMGQEGRAAVQEMLSRAQEAGLFVLDRDRE